MKIWITMILLAAFQMLSASSRPSAYHYVWAPSGINLRVEPGTDKEVIAKLAFGDSLFILSATDIPFNVMGVQNVDSTQYYSSRYERKAPYILYGSWIEVSTASGEVGYVVDQYLLPMRPYVNEYLHLRPIEKDTVIRERYGYDSKYLDKKYANNITSSYYINEKYFSESFTFPDMTMQEVFVVLSFNDKSLEYIKILQNWKGNLLLSDGMCSYVIKQMEGYVELNCECSC